MGKRTSDWKLGHSYPGNEKKKEINVSDVVEKKDPELEQAPAVIETPATFEGESGVGQWFRVEIDETGEVKVAVSTSRVKRFNRFTVATRVE